MHLRHSTNPDQIVTFDTAQLRSRYLVDDLFADDEFRATYTHEDRVVLGGVRPVNGEVSLPSFDQLRTENFFDGREAGVMNVGHTGTISVDGQEYVLEKGSCLYVGRGAKDVVFSSAQAQNPAAFYLFSATAHTSYPTVLVRPNDGVTKELGSQETSNARTLHQYIHADGVKSCQVVMGMTELKSGSMWNTMPAHTHDRRTECYLYFDIAPEHRVIHLMGEPHETRHILVADRQAVISPSWSIHCGFATGSYSFVWAMAGENQAFDDMDVVRAIDLL